MNYSLMRSKSFKQTRAVYVMTTVITEIAFFDRFNWERIAVRFIDGARSRFSGGNFIKRNVLRKQLV